MDAKALTVAQVAQRLNLSTRRITQLIRQGQFPNAQKLDESKATSPYLIPQTDFEAFLNKRGTSVAEPQITGL